MAAFAKSVVKVLPAGTDFMISKFPFFILNSFKEVIFLCLFLSIHLLYLFYIPYQGKDYSFTINPGLLNNSSLVMIVSLILP